jgi:hypothetical protein
MDSNHRYLGAGQGSLPLDHGTICSSRGGSRTHKRSPRFELGRFAGLRTVLCRASPMGFEPMISTLTGWRALQAAPRGQNAVAQVGVEPTASLVLNEGGAGCLPSQGFSFQFRGLESNQHQRVQSPMSYQLDDPGISALLDTAPMPKVRGEGFEPSSPGSKPGSLPIS